MNNNLTERYDDYEIRDIPDKIENTIDTFDDDDKSIMKSSVVGIGVGVSIGTLAGIAHYNHWISLKGIIKTIGTVASKI